jgi:hypothetical protein
MQTANCPLILTIILGIVIFPFSYAEPLPEGDTGIASRYPGDVGIKSDPEVIFSDDFETYASASEISSKWSGYFHTPNIQIAKESGNFYAEKQALEFSVPIQTVEISNTLLKSVNPPIDTLFLRYYAKYNSEFNVIGSSHNGCTISASYCCHGVPADGKNKFLISYEASRFDKTVANPGSLNVYVYHPEQRDIWGDHFFLNGEVSPYANLPYNFGPEFISRPKVIPKLGQWHCYELMVKTNTPGQRDGRIALWLDGKIIADFMNLRLRDTATLKIDQFTIDLHVKNNPLAPAKKWCDNVVAATSYIGPMMKTGIPVPKALKN